MFEIFREEWIVSVFMFSFAGLSIFLRVLLGLLYQNMIKETDNMASTKNKLLKQCKLKFSNCYQLNNGVANIPIFVDKFLNRLALGPVSFETMYHLSGQTMLLSVVSAGVGICRSILHGKMLGEILPFYIVCFAELYFYFSISTVVDIRGRRRVLKVNLVDYLENHLSARIGITESDMEMLFGPQQIGGQERCRRLGNSSGKRTVELMPIGGYSAQPAIASGSTVPFPMEGGAVRASGCAEVMADPAAKDKGGAAFHAATEPWSAQEAGRVSEEELEALLRELLAT